MISTKNALLKFAEEISGVFCEYTTTTITYNRKTFTLAYTKGGASSEHSYPAELLVSTEIDINSGFIIFKEDFLVKVSKFLGSETEYQTGYDRFDKKFLIKVDDEKFAKKVFDNSDMRQLIKWLFSKRIKCISCCGGTIEVSFFPFVLSLKKHPETMIEVFQKLSEMSKILTDIDRMSLENMM